MLDVQRADDRDAVVEQLLDVLPALLVLRAGGVRVRQLVDEGDVGLAADHRLGVHLLERDALVLDSLARHDLQVADRLDRLWPAVGLDEADDDVGASLLAPVSLLQHRVGLADAGSHAEVDPQPAARAAPGLASDALQHLLGRGALVWLPSVVSQPGFPRAS